MKPAGLTALVTGSGHRVGRALALTLTEAGANVAVHYNSSDEAAAETVAALKMAGGRAEAFQADFTDAAEVERLFEAVNARMGAVQILANNAARYERGELPSSSVEEWDRCMAVNVRAPYLLRQSYGERAAGRSDRQDCQYRGFAHCPAGTVCLWSQQSRAPRVDDVVG